MSDEQALPAPSTPVVVDTSKAKGRHIRTMAALAHVTTAEELARHLSAVYDLVHELVEGGMDERPAGDFWPAFVAVRDQLGAPAKN